MKTKSSGNPFLSNDTFTRFGDESSAVERADVMTMQGTVNKSGLLVLIVIGAAAYVWTHLLPLIATNPGAYYPWAIGGALIGFGIAIVTSLNPKMAPLTSPFYALAEGVFLGACSVIVESFYPGIVLQAVGLTFGVFIAMLLAYTTRLIKATEKFKLGVMSATGAVMLLYLMSFVLGMFGISVPFIHETGLIGIGFSVFVVVLAALNLVIDFDFIENGVQEGAPKHMEWFGAFALLVTLVWLYFEILRLLIKLRAMADD